jgi:hypothetical protein
MVDHSSYYFSLHILMHVLCVFCAVEKCTDENVENLNSGSFCMDVKPMSHIK